MVSPDVFSSRTPEPELRTLARPDGERIAYRVREGQGVGVVWLGGFHSDMGGTKAVALDDWAGRLRKPYLRFDYFGHGDSSGAFENGTIGRWTDDALAVMEALTSGPQILVGSSMGGWIATLVAMAAPERVAGIVYIAPAPDFTEDLIWEQLPDEARHEMETTGTWMRPSQYDDMEPYPLSMGLIEDGRRHLVLRANIPITCPVRILHGMEDPDVPWQRSLDLVQRLQSRDVVTTFIKDGDHRLSDEANLARLISTVEGLTRDIDYRS